MKKISQKLLALFLAGATAAFAEDIPDITTFKSAYEINPAPVLIESFDRGHEGWTLGKGFTHPANEGFNGTPCLKYERTDPKEYAFATISVKLEPNTRYKLEVDYRTDLVEDKNQTMEIFAVYYHKDGKPHHTGSFHMKTQKNSHKWSTMKMVFLTPDGEYSSRLSLLLRTARLGKIWYDNIRLLPVSYQPGYIYPVDPKHLTLDETGFVKIRAYSRKELDESTLRALVTLNGKQKLLPVKDGFAQTSFGKLPEGEYKLKTMLLDMSQKHILDTDESLVFSRPAPAPQPSIMQIHRNNKNTLDGKPFLPIGLFVGFFNTPNAEEDVKRISDAGFNSILSLGLQFRCAGEKATKRETLLASLDMLQKYNLKYIFSIKYQLPFSRARKEKYDDITGLDNVTIHAIENVRKHPTMLAWYISDENPVHELPGIRNLRTLISKHDPAHPTLTLTNIPGNCPDFAPSGDALLIDPYPIGSGPRNIGPRQSIKFTRDFIKNAKHTGQPVWLVPQVFCWGSNNEMYPLPLRFPTEEEMRAQMLEGAVQDVDAYLLYSYHYTFSYAEKRQPGVALEFWKTLVPVVQMLKELTPWLLSTCPAPAAAVESVKGEVEARAMALENGQVKVAISAVGPDESHAIITIPECPDLKSRYGNTQNLGNGKYKFTGMHVSSDILE